MCVPVWCCSTIVNTNWGWDEKKFTSFRLGCFTFQPDYDWMSKWLILLNFYTTYLVHISLHVLSVNINEKLKTLKEDFFQKLRITVSIFKKFVLIRIANIDMLCANLCSYTSIYLILTVNL